MGFPNQGFGCAFAAATTGDQLTVIKNYTSIPKLSIHTGPLLLVGSKVNSAVRNPEHLGQIAKWDWLRPVNRIPSSPDMSDILNR